MQKDFTYYIYSGLIASLKKAGYVLLPFIDYISNGSDFDRCVVIRHDVDRKPGNALLIAKIEKDAGIKASYYFRMVKESYDENVIRQIIDMGHEIGYHYENLSEMSKKNPHPGGIAFGFHRAGITQIVADYLISHRHTQTHTDIYPADLAGQKWSSLREKKEFTDKLFELSIDDFRLNLEKLRKLYPVKTICMHGSPLSKYENKEIWEKYDYRDYGIIAEPYFDIDFDEVLYITDTGRSWNNSSASIRDKVNSKFDITIKDTHDLIEKIQNNELPDKIMMNVHPQRWNDEFVPWVSELVGHNIKNLIKRILVWRAER